MEESNQIVNQNLNSALNKASLPQDMTVYRGTSKSILGDLKGLSADDLIGEEIIEKGYMSTSTSYDVASKQFGTKDVIMTIKAPKDAKGMDIAPTSIFAEESEILFQSGRKMQILEAKEINEKLHITVKMGK